MIDLQYWKADLTSVKISTSGIRYNSNIYIFSKYWLIVTVHAINCKRDKDLTLLKVGGEIIFETLLTAFEV